MRMLWRFSAILFPLALNLAIPTQVQAQSSESYDPTPPISSSPSFSGETHTREAGTLADGGVVRAEAGDFGMFFRFGGLGTLAATNNTRNVNALVITQVGLRMVLSEQLIIPMFLGLGLRSVDQPNMDANTDFGFDAGAGIEYHFRIWRRISPFVGASLGFGGSDPSGDNNGTWTIGLGPTAGVEYYVADRVSLTAQYLLTFQIDRSGTGADSHATGVSFQTLAGGAMNLSFYF